MAAIVLFEAFARVDLQASRDPFRMNE